MTDLCRIERASAKYVQGLCAAVDAVARERRYLASVQGFPLEQARQFAKAIVNDGGVQFVVLDHDTVVGWCDVRRSGFEGFRHVGILGIGVLAEYRGKGIGPGLLTHTIEAASAVGVTRIELEVYASNTRAVHLFEQAGFVTEGVKRRARLLDGREDDVVCMALLR